jgi:hypothetical protein
MAWLKSTINKKPVLVNTDGVIVFTVKGNKIVVVLANGTTLELEANSWTLEAIEPILGEIVDLTSPPSPFFTPLEFQAGLPDLSDIFGKEEEGEENATNE